MCMCVWCVVVWWAHHISFSLDATWGPSKLYDSKIFLSRLFQWNTGILVILRRIPVFCCNNHSSEILESFCKTGIILIISMILVSYSNNHNKKILEPSNLLGPMMSSTQPLIYLEESVYYYAFLAPLLLLRWNKPATCLLRTGGGGGGQYNDDFISPTKTADKFISFCQKNVSKNSRELWNCTCKSFYSFWRKTHAAILSALIISSRHQKLETNLSNNHTTGEINIFEDIITDFSEKKCSKILLPTCHKLICFEFE